MEKRNKPNKVHIVLTNSKKFQDKTLVTKQFSSPKQRERASKSSTPLPSIRQEINHITIERERERDEYSQLGKKKSSKNPSPHVRAMMKSEIEMISIYTNPLNIVCPQNLEKNTRGQQPLSCPFTKIILFNSYFAHKRNPRNMTPPLFWVMFGTFGQVVELEKGKVLTPKKAQHEIPSCK
jgi:hypothetical protein